MSMIHPAGSPGNDPAQERRPPALAPSGQVLRLAATASAAPEFLEQLVRQAEAAGASDIHLQHRGREAQIAFRLDGLMTSPATLDGDLADRVFGRIKFLARLKTYVESLPQDGRINRADVGATSDLRVSTYPTVTGEKIVLRLFRQARLTPLDELGFAAEGVAELHRFLRQGAGLLLLTGPAGSGKTTTIYSCLEHIAGDGGRHIITVEDPAEQVLPGVMQTEVNEARGLSFAAAARHLLRQDPQVLVLGEIRDAETAAVAVRAAATGHLMISTLHAGSCRGIWDRLTALCPDASAAISVLDLLWNQRLVRLVCAACQGEGCPGCLGTGFRGRRPIAEWFRLDEEIRRRLRQEGPAVIQPTCSLETAGETLLAQRLTSTAELERILQR
jgi:type II secretory ATPase GspE/PulE/Tfp pilus assembly ATPase PilB-like protein